MSIPIFDWIGDPSAWVALVTLIVLGLVEGVNIAMRRNAREAKTAAATGRASNKKDKRAKQG